jgi:hypothetical protein
MRVAIDNAPAAQPLPRPAADGAASGDSAGPKGPTVYAGIGSRRTPRDVLELMRTIGAAMARRGWVLRSGGARGADQAFAAGARAAGGPIELYLPWSAFAGQADARLARPTAAAHRIAARHHPVWERLDGRARALHARNAHQVLGADLDAPAVLIVCWTADGSLDGQRRAAGGTGQALRIAHTHRVGVVNLARPAHRAFAETFLTRT